MLFKILIKTDLSNYVDTLDVNGLNLKSITTFHMSGFHPGLQKKSEI